jgi:hypothetical protein
MQARLSTELECTPERAWIEVLRPELLLFVSWPLMTFTPLDPESFPATWDDGRYLVSLRALGFIPLGKQWIDVSKPTVETTPGKQRYQIRDDGKGTLVSQWGHTITIAETEAGHTQYIDEIVVDAGILTPLIWVYAKLFYRYRQFRLRLLVNQRFGSI